LEVFGVFETASGNNGVNAADKTWNQYGVDVLYRFLENDQLYVGGRYNYVSGDFVDVTNTMHDVSIDRIQLGAGWYMTKNILVKAEYMIQNYNDYPTGTSPYFMGVDPATGQPNYASEVYYQGASVDGFMLEATISF
jgi:hypothetical protein